MLIIFSNKKTKDNSCNDLKLLKMFYYGIKLLKIINGVLLVEKLLFFYLSVLQHTI